MAYSVNTTPLLQNGINSDEEEEVQHEVVVKDDKPLFKPLEPRDKFNVAYFILYFLGIVSLLPWNFYVTADDYWMYKFRKVSKNSSYISTDQRTPLQAEFTSYLSLASSLPNLVFLALNTVISHRISLNLRVIGSLICMLILMLFTLIFVYVDTDSWQQTFFGLTLLTIILLNVCSAIFSGSLAGVVGKFSAKYITAVTAGQSLGGIFAALAQIAALSIGASSTHSAMVYFIIGNLMIGLSIFLYVFLEKSIFFKYHVENCVGVDESQDVVAAVRSSYKIILRKMWGYGFSVFVIFAISLAVYPGVTVLVESEGKGHGNRWNDVYFVPTITYLLFSLGDYVGRIISVKIMKPKNVTLIILLSLARFIFIPLLLLCNENPRHNLAVVFDKDWQYIMIMFLFAISNGYLANLTCVLAPRAVDVHEKELASIIMTVFVGLGLTLGSTICLFLVKII
ncbi:unnamed protein product [Phaedon cochleariae]|uniref:Equilibrative nucleoside transporter 3 n=1 Tax=Phaedon cochleariae TaxID=80249 RepID=A0A9N9SH98_PHACE|nr:unnamed protein product [Phaedon cochleariae]